MQASKGVLEVMKRIFNLAIIALITGLFSVGAMAKKPGGPNDSDDPYNGNGSPSGSHFNLNILGMETPKGKTELQTIQSKGKRIFVKLGGNTKILLTEGDFAVIDYDGTDGVAAFQLPNPDPDCDGVTDYSVFARALGGGGSASIKTCADEKAGDDLFCSTAAYVAVLDRSSGGKSTFTNVSRDLLYVTGNFFGSGTKRYPLFGDSLFDYFWDYENNGLRLAQLRFYEIETNVNDGDPLTTECDFDERLLP
jgi:hypothetical protein